MIGVALVALVVLALASGSGSGGGALDAIAKAAEVTQREPGGHAIIRASVDSLTTPEGITEEGPMVFDDSGRASGTFTVRGHSTGKEEEFTSITDGTTSYTSADVLDLPEGKKWMKLDLVASAPSGGSSTPVDTGPEEGLKALEGVEDAEEVEKEPIHGVPTTHYRGTIPVSEEVFGVKVQIAPPQVDVWIDGEGRVRRTSIVITGGIDGNRETAATTHLTIDYLDFEKVPAIKLPPEDEVFDATSEIEANLQSAAEGH